MVRINIIYQLKSTSPDPHTTFKKHMTDKNWSDSYAGKSLPHTTLTMAFSVSLPKNAYDIAHAHVKNALLETMKTHPQLVLERIFISAFDEAPSIVVAV